MKTPIKIVLEEKEGVLNLRVFGRGFQSGGTVIESVKRVTGNSLPSLRKWGEEYAKRFSIPFEDETEEGRR